MKRNEMLTIMYGAALKPVPYNDDGGIQMWYVVENILKAQEEAGMLPPPYNKVFESPKGYGIITSVTESVSQWEPEEPSND